MILTTLQGALIAAPGSTADAQPHVYITLAGPTAIRSTDGPANSATFNHPAGVAVDAAGNIYIADSENHTIRKLAGGVVSTIAGAPDVPGSNDGRSSVARSANATSFSGTPGEERYGPFFATRRNRRRLITAA